MPERDWAEVVRNLRAKADSTSYPAEAESLRARADEIAAKYGVVEEPEGDDLDEQLAAYERQWEAWEAEQLRLIEAERVKFRAGMDQLRAQAEWIRAQRRNQQWWPNGNGAAATSTGWVMTVTFG